MTEPLYKNLKDPITKAWLHHIYLMAHNYQYGWSQIVTGQPGSGKSMSIVTLAELLSRGTFNADKIGFTPEEYITTLENIKIGEPVVWSELGASLSSRRWYTLSNILVTQVVQTMRIKKPIVLMDASDLSFIDVQARKLIFCYSEVQRTGTSSAKLRLYNIRINRRTGDIYFPHPLINWNGTTHKLKFITLKRRPSEEIWKEFDKRQRKFKQRLEDRAKNLIRIAQKKEAGAKQTVYDIINKVVADKTPYLNKRRNLDTILIKHKFDITHALAAEVKKVIEMKDKTI